MPSIILTDRTGSVQGAFIREDSIIPRVGDYVSFFTATRIKREAVVLRVKHSYCLDCNVHLSDPVQVYLDLSAEDVL